MPVRKGNKKTGASKLKKKGKASEPAGKKTLGQESASSSGQVDLSVLQLSRLHCKQENYCSPADEDISFLGLL